MQVLHTILDHTMPEEDMLALKLASVIIMVTRHPSSKILVSMDR